MPLQPNSIVKIKTPINEAFQSYGFSETDRFIYLGTIAQDPTRCIVVDIQRNSHIPYFTPDLFEEVAANDF